MLISISQISHLTGRDRRTIAKQLKDLHYNEGERGTFAIPIDRSVPARLCRGQLRSRAREGRVSLLLRASSMPLRDGNFLIAAYGVDFSFDLP